ncbi:PQQ-binding-like beta-propeller repeat protein [candidate division WOR-3 bacterium]|nr:PQQ-binding-like beta-propeller repeat protein [candidate division WOR-3 bacterium]
MFAILLWMVSSVSTVEIPFFAKGGCQKVEFYCSSDGENWRLIAEKLNPVYPNSWEDRFIWKFRGKYSKEGRIRVVYVFPQGKEVAEVKNVQVKVVEDDGPGYFYYGRTKRINKTDTTYSWRMLGYDAQHTGYYPHPLYPPLEFKWQFSGINGHDFMMIQPCAAYDMLYVGDGYSNWILALSLETGEVVWKEELTANVCCAALCPGDSILFVGTWMSWDTLQPTFFALDPLTGEEKWARAFRNSVGNSPICVDSLVFLSGPNNHTLYAWNLRGDLLWSRKGITELSPSYWNGRIYGGGSPPVEPPLLWCLDAISGDSIWAIEVGNGPEWQTIYENKIFFFATDTLFGLDLESGEPQLKITGFYTWFNDRIAGYNGDIWIAGGEYGAGDTIFTRVQSWDAQTGAPHVDFYLAPKDSNGGRSNLPLGTQGGVSWVTNTDYIYAFRTDGTVIDTVLLPDSPQIWPSWGFPIVYKNYFIGAHRSFIYVYTGDTGVQEDTIDAISTFTFFGYQAAKNSLGFFLSIPERKEVIIRIFDIAGRLRGIPYQGYLPKGEYRLSWDANTLSSGVYFVSLEADLYRKTVKVAFLRGGKK